MEYKVGDSVTIISKLTHDRAWYKYHFNEGMDKYLGQTLNITRIIGEDNYILNDIFYYWSKEMFEQEIENITEKIISSYEGGTKMENKYSLLNLYESNKNKEILEYYAEQMKIVKEKEVKEITEMNTILSEAQEKLTKLYMSQFTEEEIEGFGKGMMIDISTKPLKRVGDILVSSSMSVNNIYFTDEINNLEILKEKDLTELIKIISEVRAHLALAENKEQVEEILINYDILNKKTKQLNK